MEHRALIDVEEVVRKFREDSSSDDFRVFLWEIDCHFEQAIMCIRLHFNFTLCEAYKFLFEDASWRAWLDALQVQNKKSAGRILRQLRRCEQMS